MVNDYEYTNKQIDDEEDEAPKVTLVPTSTPADVSKANIETTNSDLSLNSTTKEAIVEGTLSIPSSHVRKNHPSSSIIDDPSTGITTRKKDKVDYSKMIVDLCYASTIEPTSIEVTLKDEYWINVMQEELLQFKHNNVWTLVPKPNRANITGTKWIFKNKTDESGCVTRNKARLVAQGYAQVEGVNFDETFASVSRLEAIRLLLGMSCIRKFKLYQMDVKSALQNGYLNEEVYVAQPKGFVDYEFPQHVYKLNKALYVLKQAPKAWYERLTIYLGNKEYSRGGTDKILFTNRTNSDLIVAQIYVDNIEFGGFPKAHVDNFIDIMKSEFEMSMVEELSCFLVLQIKQRSEGIFISQEKHVKNIVKKFGLDQSQHKRTPAVTHVKITKDINGTTVDHKCIGA
ncbi:hypothetical protein IC575_016384 [Cucumis melo]